MGKAAKLSNKLISTLMSIVLVVGLCPLPAYAREASATDLGAGSTSLLDTLGTEEISEQADVDDLPIISWEEEGDWTIEAKNLYVTGPTATAVPEISVTCDGEPVDPSKYILTVSAYNPETEEYSDEELPADSPLTPGSYMAFYHVRTESGSSASGIGFDVIDIYDLANASVFNSGMGIPTKGEPVSLESWRSLYMVVDDAGNSMRIDSECYNISAWQTADGTDLESAPSKAGDYRAVFTGSGPYHGSKTVDFSVVDAYDIANAFFYSADTAFYVESDRSIDLELRGNDHFDIIKQGEAFQISGYKDANGNDLSVTPSEQGTYTAVLTGVSPYYGTYEFEYTIYARNDLSTAFVEVGQRDYAYTGDPVEPAVTVKMRDGSTLERGKDYTISYLKDYGVDGSEAAFGDAPTGIGFYRILIEAAEGSGYIGSYNQASFSIVDGKNLSSGSIRNASESTYPVYSYNDGSAVDVHDFVVTDVNGNALQEGVDYVLKYQGHQNYWGEFVNQVSEEGMYAAFAEGINDYYGTTYNRGDATFCIAKPEHDISKAEVSFPQTFNYEGGQSLAPRISESIKVTLAGKDLVEGTDFRLFYSKAGDGESGTLGTHRIWMLGRGLDGESEYYGEQYLYYEVVDGELYGTSVPVAHDLLYTGEPQRGVPDSDAYVLSGTYEAVNVGTYEAVATLAQGYIWDDGTTEPKTITWRIYPVSKQPLADAIADGEAALDGVVASDDGSDVPVGSKWALTQDVSNLQGALATGRALMANDNVTYEQRNAALQTIRSYTGLLHPRVKVRSVPVYRLHYKTADAEDYLWTASAEEVSRFVAAGWTNEGVAMYAAETSGTPLYRQHNPNMASGSYNITTSKAENDYLARIGWEEEGIAFYATDTPSPSRCYVYRLYGLNTGIHFYTTSRVERDVFVKHGWSYEGIGWVAEAAGDAQARFGIDEVLDSSTVKVPSTWTEEDGVQIGNGLVEGQDYTARFVDGDGNEIAAPTRPGEYLVEVTGEGELTGTTTLKFVVAAPGDLYFAEVESDDVTAGDEDLCPIESVSLDGVELQAGADYTVTYYGRDAYGDLTIDLGTEPPADVGNYLARIKGTGAEGAGYFGSPRYGVYYYVLPALSDDPEVGMNMYRLFNPDSGEHFYTAVREEVASLTSMGWIYQGVGWVLPIPRTGTPVYRLYNPYVSDHHYTTSAAERDHLVALGWSYEGIGWYSDKDRGVPVYRVYNPYVKTGSHLYTTSEQERDDLVKLGWRNEGIGWYGVAEGSAYSGTPDWADRTDLYTAIEDANTALDGLVASDDGRDAAPGARWATPAHKQALEDALTAAEGVRDYPGASQDAVDSAVGNLREAIEGLDAQVKPDAVPVYRLHYKTADAEDYLWTASAEEVSRFVAAGWTNEGIAMYVPETSDTPLYRLHDPDYTSGSYHYTTIEEDDDYLASIGRELQGIAFYTGGSVPVYRLRDTATNTIDFYTTSRAERNVLLAQNDNKDWVDCGVEWYAEVAGDAQARFRIDDVLDSSTVKVPSTWTEDDGVPIGDGLIEGQDYTTRFVDGDGNEVAAPTRPGEYLVEVTGEGELEGTTTLKFVVAAPGDLYFAEVKTKAVTAGDENLCPVESVSLDGVELQEGTDYTVTYYGSDVNDNLTTELGQDPPSGIGAYFARVRGTGSEDSGYFGSPKNDVRYVMGPYDPAANDRNSLSMYRLANPYTYERHYTAAKEEVAFLVGVGWVYEGLGWVAPIRLNTPVYRLNTPVYRVYDPTYGNRFYTTSAEERDAKIAEGWRYEGVGWYSAESDGVPVYRYTKPDANLGNYRWTTSLAEGACLEALGWHADGVAWYGVAGYATSPVDELQCLTDDANEALDLSDVEPCANDDAVKELASGTRWMYESEYDELTGALAAARDVLAKQAASDSDAQSAVDALKSAIVAYSQRIFTTQRDATALQAAIGTASTALDGVSVSADGKDLATGTPWVTEAEKTAFEDALAAARDVLADETASQKTCDDAASALEAAVAVLDVKRTYRVTFDSNGGSQTPAAYVNGGDALQEPAEPERTGYTFEGWKDAQGEDYDFTSLVSADFTLKASWTAIVYSIAYDLDGGSWPKGDSGQDVSSPSAYSIETADFTLVAPERDHYTFTGWTGTGITGDTPDWDVTVQQGSMGNRSYKANWVPKRYMITFLDEDGTRLARAEYEYGTKGSAIDVKPDPDPVKASSGGYDYEFEGWVASDSTNPSMSLPNVTGAETYTASYAARAHTYEIRYENVPDGVSNPNPVQYSVEGSDIELADLADQDDARFVGWYSAADVSRDADGKYAAAVGADPIQVINAGDATDYDLVAIWEEIPDEPQPNLPVYTVVFNSNGGTKVASVQVREGEKVPEPEAPTKPGYTFKNWRVGVSGSDFDFTNDVVTGNLTLRAMWDVVTYHIIYEDSEHAHVKDSVTNPRDYRIDTATFSLPGPNDVQVDEGYVFSGWFYDKGLTMRADSKVRTGTTGNKTLYAGTKGIGRNARDKDRDRHPGTDVRVEGGKAFELESGQKDQGMEVVLEVEKGNSVMDADPGRRAEERDRFWSAFGDRFDDKIGREQKDRLNNAVPLTSYDVELEMQKPTGEVVYTLSEPYEIGSIDLTLPVKGYEGRKVIVYQLHQERDGSSTPLIREGVVENGFVRLRGVDRLSEFYIVAEAQNFTKPTKTDFTYDGKPHQGVQEDVGYTLSGDVTATKVGTYKVTATLNEGYQWTDGTTDPVTLTWKITAKSSPTPARPASRPMYRLYNPNSGEHFYTAETGERDHLAQVGWSYEGIGWYAPLAGQDVYRLYNAYAGDHHYTPDASERDYLMSVGWSFEGVGWKSGGSVPLYRQYNPNAKAGSHNYTTSKSENDWLVSLGWRAEGVGWNAVS